MDEETHKLASLGKLLAGIVHELNTPIGSIFSNNEVILRSLEILKKNARTEDLVLTKPNGGKGSAVRMGLEHATGEFAVIQDADLEYDPREISGLLEFASRHPGSAVFGSRFLKRNPNIYPLALIGNKILTLIVNLCFFPVMINTLRGLTSVHPSSVELMRSYAAGRARLFRHVRIPNALPHLFTGLKVATVLSMIGAIVGEYFGGPTSALGVSILNASSYGRFTDAWAGIVMASAFGILFYALVAMAERLTTSWHPSARAFRSE